MAAQRIQTCTDQANLVELAVFDTFVEISSKCRDAKLFGI